MFTFLSECYYGLVGLVLEANYRLNQLLLTVGFKVANKLAFATAVVSDTGTSGNRSFSPRFSLALMLLAANAHPFLQTPGSSFDPTPFAPVLSTMMDAISWIIFIAIVIGLTLEVLKVLSNNTPQKRSEMIKNSAWFFVIGVIYFVARGPIVDLLKKTFGVSYDTSGFKSN